MAINTVSDKKAINTELVGMRYQFTMWLRTSLIYKMKVTVWVKG